MLHASPFQHLDSDEALHETSNQTSEILNKKMDFLLLARDSVCLSELVLAASASARLPSTVLESWFYASHEGNTGSGAKFSPG